MQKLLLKNNPKLNDKYMGLSTIYNALQGENYQLVNLLIDMGATISGVDYKGLTLLDLAFKKWENETSIRILKEFKDRQLLRNDKVYLLRGLSLLDYDEFLKINDFLKIDMDNYEDVLELALTKDIKDKHKKVKYLLNIPLFQRYNLKSRNEPLFLEYLYNENSRKMKGRAGEFAPDLWDILDKTPKSNLIKGNDSLLYVISQKGSREQIKRSSFYYKSFNDFTQKIEYLQENNFNSFRIIANLISRGFGDLIPIIMPCLNTDDFVSQDGWTALTFLTLYKDYKEPLKAMVEAGFNINLKMKNGNHLISRLAKYEDYETIIWLANRGAVIDSASQVAGFIPTGADISKAKSCIKELIKIGALKE